MKTSTKAILGVYGAFVGAWLAGSAYFLANGRDEELDDGLIQIEEPLPREENAYYLFPKLHEFHQTNYNFIVANHFVNGWTNGPALLAEMSELVDAHSNLFACARKIVACRGYQIPADENKMMAISPLVGHPTAWLYQMKSASFDRGYAKKWEFDEDRISPFRENWLGVQVVRHWNMHDTYERHYRSLFGWRAGRLQLACENYRFAKGRYPTELAELVPDCIESVPLDPYDGEPIRYNAEHGYFWTPGPDGAFDGKVDFDEDGYPKWKNRCYNFVRLLDTTKVNRPPATYCNMSRRKTHKRAK